MTDTKPITPDYVRDLIAVAKTRIDGYPLPNKLPLASWSDREVIEGLTDALEGTLPAEDADLEDVLDRIESSISLAFEGEGEAWSDQLSGGRLAAVAARAVEPITDRLLARARATEAEREEAKAATLDAIKGERDAALVEAAHARDSAAELVRATLAREQALRESRDLIYESRQQERAKVRDLTAERDALIASRTTETGEEWEGVLECGSVQIPYFNDHNRQIRTRSVARDRSRWERDGWTLRKRAADTPENAHDRYPLEPVPSASEEQQ